MQSIPLAVLKHNPVPMCEPRTILLHAIHTACGIETHNREDGQLQTTKLHAIHTACGIETARAEPTAPVATALHAIHTACGIETAKGLL